MHEQMQLLQLSRLLEMMMMKMKVKMMKRMMMWAQRVMLMKMEYQLVVRAMWVMMATTTATPWESAAATRS
jgi:hypothetical protein